MHRRSGSAAELGAGGRRASRPPTGFASSECCGTAGGSSPRAASTSPTPDRRCRGRPSWSGRSRCGTGETSRGQRAGALPDRRSPTGRRRGSGATEWATRRCRCREPRRSPTTRDAMVRRLPACPYLRRAFAIDAAGAPGDAVRHGARRASSSSSTAPASATPSWRPAGRTTTAGSSTPPTTSRRCCAPGQRARRDPRRRLVRRHGRLRGAARGQPLRPRSASCCASCTSSSRTAARRGDRVRRGLAGRHRAARVLRPADGRALRRPARARRLVGARIRRGELAARGGRAAGRRAAGARASAADPGHRGAAPGLGHAPRARGARLRPRAEHGRLGAAGGARGARRARAAAPRRDARARRLAVPRRTCAARRQLDTYVLRGGGPEVCEPRFTFHGFRYVEVSGLPDDPGSTR